MSLCKLCEIGFLLYNGVCLESCLIHHNSISCKNDVRIIKECEEDYFVNEIDNKCEIICPNNCLNCQKNILDIICLECQNEFVLFDNFCLDLKCFGNLCNNCQEDFKIDCDICNDCLNLNFNLKNNCDIIPFCEICDFKESNISCIRCKENYFLSSNFICYEIKNFENNKYKVSIIFNEVLDIKCFEGFILHEGICYEILSNCYENCLQCFEEKELFCLNCEDGYFLFSNDCLLDSFVNNNKDIFVFNDFFTLQKKNCVKIINKIKIFTKIIIKDYFNLKEFSLKESIDSKALLLDCFQEKEKCENLFKNLNFEKYKNDNCDNFTQEIYTKIIHFIHITNNNNFKKNCINENTIKIKNSIICKDVNCLNFEKISEYFHLNKVNNCASSSHTQNYLESYKNILECDFCQQGNNFLCPWKLTCNNNCDFNLFTNIDTDNQWLKIKNIEDFEFSKKNLKLETPFYIAAKLSSENSIEFEFRENIKYFNFKLNSKLVKQSKNCIIKKEKIYKIKNNKYQSLKNSPTFKFIVKNNNYILSTGLIGINIFLFSSIPSFFFEFLQFNQLFSHFRFLDIDGGIIFNYFTFLFKVEDDNEDYFVSDKSKLEYDFIKNKLYLVNTISFLDYLLLFSSFFLLIFTFCFHLFNKKINKFLKKAYENDLKRKKSIKINKVSKINKYKNKIKRYMFKGGHKKIINNYYKIIWNMFIFNFPGYILIFLRKNIIYNVTLKIIFSSILFLIIVFFFHRYLKFWKFINTSFKESKRKYNDFLILKKEKFVIENIFLNIYNLIFITLNCLIIFLVYFLKNFPEFYFIILIILLICNMYLYIHFFNEKFNKILIFKILNILFFLIWFFLVALKKIFSIYIIHLLDIFYFLCNLFKVIEIIFSLLVIKKMEKKSK